MYYAAIIMELTSLAITQRATELSPCIICHLRLQLLAAATAAVRIVPLASGLLLRCGGLQR